MVKEEGVVLLKEARNFSSSVSGHKGLVSDSKIAGEVRYFCNCP